MRYTCDLDTPLRTPHALCMRIELELDSQAAE